MTDLSMEPLRRYLLNRASSGFAWIGVIGFMLEILLHIGHHSTVMLLLFAALIVLPEAVIRDQFAKWNDQLKELDKP
jgi:hypothetical protein